MASSKVAINSLDPDHLDAVQRSLQHILSTQLAENIFAQIVDGLPTRNADQYMVLSYNPEIHERDDPSSIALNVVTEWRSMFQPESLSVDSDVAQAYQNTAVGTRDFHLRLIEITAVALHTIASNLFLHTNQPPYKSPQPPPKIDFPVDDIFVEPPVTPIRREMPTYLYHQNYIYYDQYPMGVADMVGYWAEYQIFGGVVLFDRGASEKEFRDVFFHPSAGFRVFKLSDTQIGQFIDFCLHGEVACPFPMKAERHALRIDAGDTFAMHIFRNKYERNPPVTLPWITRHPRRRLEDDPDAMDVLKFVKERTGGGST